MTPPRKQHRPDQADAATDAGAAGAPSAGGSAEGSPTEVDGGGAVVEDVVDVAAAQWRNRLGDLAGGSALWDVGSLGEAVVDLTAAHPGGIAQLFAGRPTKLSNLAREGSALTHARRRARIVGARTEELAQRYGFAPTYVAIGVASWTPGGHQDHAGTVEGAPGAGDDDHARHEGAVNVPVLLRPVTITVHPADAEVTLELDPAVEINPVLVRALRSHGVAVDPDEVVAQSQTAHGFSPAPALDAVERAAATLADFDLEPHIVLGAFVHPGQALAEDLDTERLREHEVVAALAGSPAAIANLRRPLPERRLADPDPETERGAGDLDAGQHRVLDAVDGGGHLFVDAPPGVDVPGTVAALAAQAAAEGKQVLYVPGTKRAGESLHASMRALGLGDLVLDLGSDTRWRETVARRLVDGLDARVPETDPQVQQVRRELGEARTALAGYVRALHTARAPWDASAYLAMQELAELTSQRPGPRTQVRLDPQALAMTMTERQHAREELARAAALGAFRLRASDTPWYGVVLTSAEHATETLARVRRLAQMLPTLIEQAAATAAQTGLDEAQTLGQWSDQLELLEGIRASFDLFVPAVFERSAADMAAACASRTWRAEKGIALSWGTRRRLRKQARDLLRPGVAVHDLHAELQSVQARRELWRRHCAGGGWPRLPEGMTDILATEHDVVAEVAQLQDVLSPSMDDVDLRDVPLTELMSRLEKLADDDATLRQMPERAGVLGHLQRLGLRPLVEDLTVRRVPTELVGAEFDLAWWSSLLEEVLRGDPALADLDADSLDTAAARLRELDLAQTHSLRDPILRGVSERVRAAIAADKPAAQDFYRAVHAGTTDLKDLRRRFGRVVWAPRPVWIVPPMLVPQVLEPERSVDIVVLDAVQHLPTEQAIAAISRGKQIVVVGDSRRGGDGLVAAARVLPSVELPGDRLDLDAEIAGFLAEHGYGDVIRPVPGPPRPPGLSLEVVAGTGMPVPGAEAVESVQAEVDRVVDLVIEHALTRPETSLAVIALNARHADRVRDAVLSTAAGASVAAFFDPAAPEPFTVVDVESVAGLRRDAVILTVGYGKTPHGRVLYRFGAVGADHGAELLVDVLDACRHRLTVVSCIDPDELDTERLRTRGAVALRDLLSFARTGSEPRAAEETEQAPTPDRLLRDLSERLERLGLVVVPRYGAPGGVRVPLAVGHPSLPGELLLAVLTDDADYVSETSLRRRDRHWVQRLENRGWQVRMVFSSAVFMDPQGEARAIKDAVEEIVAERTATPAAVAAPAPPLLIDDADDADDTGDADDTDDGPEGGETPGDDPGGGPPGNGPPRGGPEEPPAGAGDGPGEAPAGGDPEPVREALPDAPDEQPAPPPKEPDSLFEMPAARPVGGERTGRDRRPPRRRELRRRQVPAGEGEAVPG